VSKDGAVLLFLPGIAPLSLTGDDADRMAGLQELLLEPIPSKTVAAQLGDVLFWKLLQGQFLLGGERAVLDRLRPVRLRPSTRPLKRLVFGVCGTFAAATVVPLVDTALYLLADEVDVVLTRAAKRFLRPRVLRYLGARTFTDAYASKPGATVPHIHLAQDADAVLIAPASAASLARFARGDCDDLLSLIVAATAAPVIVAPVMNHQMWRNPAIVRNIARLREDGIYVVAPDLGASIASRTRSASTFESQIGALGLPPETLVSLVTGIVDLSRLKRER
jgi:3-polyprenyl-4-hydroxybenzoate decarboxylase